MCFNVNLYLIKAVERNVPTKSATESDLQKELVKFIHGASDREGGRLARKKAAKQIARSSDSSAKLANEKQTSDSEEDNKSLPSRTKKQKSKKKSKHPQISDSEED